MMSALHEERRNRPDLRVIFDEARRKTEKFFLPDGKWSGESVDYLAARVLREQFPGLTPPDITLLVGVIARRCQMR